MPRRPPDTYESLDDHEAERALDDALDASRAGQEVPLPFDVTDLLVNLNDADVVLCRPASRDVDETLLEVVAEALAASYDSTTFATAGRLIVELERRGRSLRRTAGAPVAGPVAGGPGTTIVTFGGPGLTPGAPLSVDRDLAAAAYELGRRDERGRRR